jgi:energy-coupling factor transporter ATP-binding protein EcfA2
MNNIVILCGANSCGKSTTLKGFFGIAETADAPEYNERKLDGKIVCSVSFGVTFGSPQEQSPFCNVERVQENINSRIRECDKKATSKPYFLIIPFTMSGSRKKKKKVNADCILKPIEELRKKHHVFVVYLRKTNTHHLKEKDALMKDIAIATIPTTEEDYDKSKDLEKVLRDKILKS